MKLIRYSVVVSKIRCLLCRSEVIVVVIDRPRVGMGCSIAPSLGLEPALDMSHLGELSFATHLAPFATSSDSVWSGTLDSLLWTLHSSHHMDY